ncbi:MAG: zinc ribbon domain-containing protein [Desulfobacteraceae bacterium]|nr:MAG: zinc ribbon domain-containing protein [Desulfobacteraceae bacterium]
MFFLIAGVQPKIRTLEDGPQRCPRCGLHQAYRQRVDHYLSLFFVPLIRVKTGDAYLFCRHCQKPVGHFPQGDGTVWRTQCSRCGGDLKHEYTYCPHCGQRL